MIDMPNMAVALVEYAQAAIVFVAIQVGSVFP
jgi:hypothetical protein